MLASGSGTHNWEQTGEVTLDPDSKTNTECFCELRHAASTDTNHSKTDFNCRRAAGLRESASVLCA